MCGTLLAGVKRAKRRQPGDGGQLWKATVGAPYRSEVVETADRAGAEGEVNELMRAVDEPRSGVAPPWQLAVRGARWVRAVARSPAPEGAGEQAATGIQVGNEPIHGEGLCRGREPDRGAIGGTSLELVGSRGAERPDRPADTLRVGTRAQRGNRPGSQGHHPSDWEIGTGAAGLAIHDPHRDRVQ